MITIIALERGKRGIERKRERLKERDRNTILQSDSSNASVNWRYTCEPSGAWNESTGNDYNYCIREREERDREKERETERETEIQSNSERERERVRAKERQKEREKDR